MRVTDDGLQGDSVVLPWGDTARARSRAQCEITGLVYFVRLDMLWHELRLDTPPRQKVKREQDISVRRTIIVVLSPLLNCNRMEGKGSQLDGVAIMARSNT